MHEAAGDPNTFAHVRVALGIIVGLGITRLLTGLARFVAHPGRQKPDAVHLLWVASVLLLLLHFWWWQFSLARVVTWHFGLFAFVAAYAALCYLLCALLFPDDIAEYAGYGDYFLSRRRWFFGLLAAVVVFDAIDTTLKGPARWQELGPEYVASLMVHLLLYGVAAWVSRRSFHLAFAAAVLVYQASWILRLYDVLG